MSVNLWGALGLVLMGLGLTLDPNRRAGALVALIGGVITLAAGWYGTGSGGSTTTPEPSSTSETARHPLGSRRSRRSARG